jgi:hypothetical protein
MADFVEPIAIDVDLPTADYAEPVRGISYWRAARYCLTALLGCAAIVMLSEQFGLRASLGGTSESVNIARSLLAGEGFAHPFGEKTGPTAWKQPLVPLAFAGILYVAEDNLRGAEQILVDLHLIALCGTFLLVMFLIGQTTRFGPEIAAAGYFLIALANFRACFVAVPLDFGLIAIPIDLMIAGFCWAKPLTCGTRAAAWGLFGGVTALLSPIAGFAWGGMTVALALRERSWSRLGIALVCAAVALAPWTIRNYLVFGRLIPVKSNLPLELHQSQCSEPTGVLRRFNGHPYHSHTKAGREYRALGEMAFLDLKRDQYWQSVRSDPENFCNRVIDRFMEAMVAHEAPVNLIPRLPWIERLTSVVHPLPLVALAILGLQAIVAGLSWKRWATIGVYLLYLGPYVVISYYDRYGIPLLGVKVLLVVWAADAMLDWSVRLWRHVFNVPEALAR